MPDLLELDERDTEEADGIGADELRMDDASWLERQFGALTTELVIETPSSWAEKSRYLPASVTSMPGFYRFEVAPYLKEIVDCMGVESPVREVAVMKGAQVCMTVGVLENTIGYYIDAVKTAPVMMVTADAELAKMRVESYVLPMLKFSGLEHLIKSSDEGNSRKTGKTGKKIEWVGGGSLIPYGAQNASKLRSVSIQVMLRDEIDGWPDVVGKDGDPLSLSASRTSAYETSYKILDLSTPLIHGRSKIESRYLLGDQRQYFVCCFKCGFPQVLKWSRTNPRTGEVTGITWDTEGGRLVEESVRYLCENCGAEHFNDDKIRLLSPDHGAEWKPTAVAQKPTSRSYHLSALYSPVGMQTWVAQVHAWREAWDEETNKPKDLTKLQVVYNNIFGKTFKVYGERVKLENVSLHRRTEYVYGEIPNTFAEAHCEGPVMVVVCSVDVHKSNLAVAVWGWCRGKRVLLLDYWRFEGETEHLDDAPTWGRLRELIEEREYVADDGKRYRISLTVIDSGYEASKVYEFASEYEAGVFPVKGVPSPVKGSAAKEYSPFTSRLGTIGYSITADIYKDRWSTALRREWDPMGLQPPGHFNAPANASEKQLKELTAEVKRERKGMLTGQSMGHEWYRPSGADNELWDCLVYASAALDMIAADICTDALRLPAVSWGEFFDYLETEQIFFTVGVP